MARDDDEFCLAKTKMHWLSPPNGMQDSGSREAWNNPPKVAATLNNDSLACEMETLVSTKAATNFSEDDVSAWTTNVRGARATAFCARVSVNHHIKRSCPSKRDSRATAEQFECVVGSGVVTPNQRLLFLSWADAA